MNFLSVCSGIEAASVAWSPLGWKAVAFSEIEPFPCSVLKHHYPDTPNLGDMTKYKDWPDDLSIDLLCGGTPCQSFSVAGLRKGLDDPRGNLMLTYGAIAAKYQPKWLVWENVPGVLSSNGGRGFGTFLGMLGQLGYGFAYKICDAQYFGVAQRRRRVFVVGCLGDWHSAAAVLFEQHSLQGHPAPRRKAGKGFTHDLAPCLTSSGRGIERTGDTRGQDPVIATFCMSTGQAGAEIGADVGTTLHCGHEAPIVFDTTQITSPANYSNPQAGDPCHPLAAQAHVPAIAFQTKGEGYGRMDGGTPQGSNDLPAGAMRTVRSDGCGGASQERGLEGPKAGEPAAPLQKLPHEGPQVREEMHALRQSAQGLGLLRDALPALKKVGRSDGGEGQPVHAIAEGLQQAPTESLPSPGLHGEVPREGVLQQARSAGAPRDAGPATDDQIRSVTGSMAVRRLLPVECEALQGFPKNYTNVPHRGKPAADGPRYKALGNSWAAPVARWVGERIEAVEAMVALKDVIKVEKVA